ncbi:hypothetical protein HHK36_023371 [Tetracentron sinense]|uniref:Uncharacterized protein n=1 Tax=Tetracentron sinense TaxID=13715 RepID=A0A834YT14_TETSI|nr:hypothetical protein HHK36_023371 [Tetracentron sinense]
MALPSAFQERLQQMEEIRNQRLSLLQAEKELQTKKYLLLASKLSNIRFMEQRCLMQEQKKAVLSFKILANKSEIESLEAKYQSAAQQFRDLKCEVEALEECKKEKENFYEMKSSEMKEFKEEVERCVSASRMQVQAMRNSVNELKSSLNELQGNNGYFNNSEIAAAETRKAELLAVKENLERSLASNYQLRAHFQKQLQSLLFSQNQEGKKLTQSSQRKSQN